MVTMHKELQADVDIVLPSQGQYYNLIYWDSINNTFGIGTMAGLPTLSDGCYFTAIVFANYDICYSDLALTLNGRINNVPLASLSTDGLLSSNDKNILENLDNTDYPKKVAVTKSDFVIIEQVNGQWHFKVDASCIGIRGNFSNQAADINLSELSSVYKMITINILTGVISAAPWTTNNLSNNELILMVTAPDHGIVYSIIDYTFDGRPNNIPLATTEKAGLLSPTEKERINRGGFYNYAVNYPIIPNDIFVLDNMPTPLFKDSMVLNPFMDCGLRMLLTTIKDGYHRTFDLQSPLNVEYSKVGDSGRITLAQKTANNKNIYKDITIHKATLQSKSGNTPKLLMIGDSLTHGDNGAQSSPIVKVNELLPIRYNITPNMIGTFAPFGILGEGRGCFNFEAMAGLENNPYNGSYHFPSVGGTLESSSSKTTTQFQNPFTFPATAEDLTNHPEWCFTNSNNYPSEDDGVSYADATAEQRANWHFFTFDFDRYIHIWGDENHIPDVITIALGTNDWWPNYQIHLEKTLLAIDIIYTKIRAAVPNAKIAFVSSQNIATSFQNDARGNWETEIVPLILNIQKKISIWKAGGDTNVYELPIYACGSRWLAFDGHTAGTPTDLSAINTVKEQTIDANVHLLDGVGSDGYWEYMECLMTAIVYLS